MELLQAFPDEHSCISHLEELRWEENVVSPFDSSSKVYKCKDNKYRCTNTKKYFNVKTHTLFDNTKIPLRKWFRETYIPSKFPMYLERKVKNLELQKETKEDILEVLGANVKHLNDVKNKYLADFNQNLKKSY